MTKPRIAPLEPPYPRDVEVALEKWMPPNSPVEPLALFRTLAKSRLLSERMRPLGAGLLGKGSLDAPDRELLILRTCQNCGAEYEWGVHAAAFARPLGFSDGQLRGQQLSPWQTLLVRAADELHQQSTLSDDTFAQLSQRLSEEQLLELLALCGFYHLISFVANAARVPLEPWAERF
jgi:alkylhydroperoxidase family enzyme